MECLEIGGFIVRRAILPTPIQHANPFEGERAHSGLMDFPIWLKYSADSTLLIFVRLVVRCVDP
jgi:hypothetical protein